MALFTIAARDRRRRPAHSSSTTFRIASNANFASAATPGVVALAYVAVLDNAENTKFEGITSAEAGNYSKFNNFFDMWDDEKATIEHFNNNAIPDEPKRNLVGMLCVQLWYPEPPAGTRHAGPSYHLARLKHHREYV